MRLDRERQREILEALAEVYPSYITQFVDSENERADLEIIWYLREHELVEASLVFSVSGSMIFQGARITAKGMDFLADDGGLSAILGTVTVKLHADTIRELILSRVEASASSESEKSWVRTTIESMSSEGLKTLTRTLVQKGLDRTPDLIALLNNAV